MRNRGEIIRTSWVLGVSLRMLIIILYSPWANWWVKNIILCAHCHWYRPHPTRLGLAPPSHHPCRSPYSLNTPLLTKPLPPTFLSNHPTPPPHNQISLKPIIFLNNWKRYQTFVESIYAALFYLKNMMGSFVFLLSPHKHSRIAL